MRRQSGIVLVVVIFFALLLASTVATFAKIALIDHMVVRNRDARARAEALARGGIRLAEAILLEDKLGQKADAPGRPKVDNSKDLWARISGTTIPFEDGSSLRLDIQDAAAKLNLNAVVVVDDAGVVDPKSPQLLTSLFTKVTKEMKLPRGEENAYDPEELAANLIDYVDKDDVRQNGEPEADAYQKRDPPTKPADQPLLSVDELRRVEGFDARLVDALRPYVTVYPYKGGGINPNTAAPYVLSLLFFDDEVQLRLADPDTVRSILKIRKEGGFVCGEDQSGEGCTPIRSLVTNAIFPTPTYTSDVFTVTALAQVGDVARRIEVVLDRSDGSAPRLLSWRAL
jgi:general secretion pathway protein K